MMTWPVISCTSLLLLLLIAMARGINYLGTCKWSNEGCSGHTECCSESCVQLHPGTNYRCSKTDMGGLCIYSFHCGHRMICGSNNRCCAKHWGTCSRSEDCCVPFHTCQKTQGFIYKKCRMRPKGLLPMAAFAERTVSQSPTILIPTCVLIWQAVLQHSYLLTL